MAQDVQLPFPLKGRSDNVAFGTQPPDTTREATNVRGMDPKTGRIRGAQRPGCSKYASAVVSSGNKVQALASISYDRPKIRYQELDGDGITVSWSGLSGGQNEGVDVDIDRQGNVYLLDRSGVVEKRNSDGELLRTITIPADSYYQIPRNIIVDSDESFYVMSSPKVAGEATSLVWRFRLLDDEDHVYAVHWTLENPGAVRDMDVRLGTLVLLTEGDDTSAYHLASFSFLFAAEPIQNWTRTVPSPAYSVHIDRHGSVFTTHPADIARGPNDFEAGFAASAGADATTGLFSEAQLHDMGLVKAPSSTTGDELPDDNDERDVSRHRIHAMLMADHITGVQENEETGIGDHRYVLGRNPKPRSGQVEGDLSNPEDYGVAGVDGAGFGVGGPTDNRNVRDLGTVFNERPGPIYKRHGAWRLASIRFDASAGAGSGNPTGTCLKSRLNSLGAQKTDTSLPADAIPDADGPMMAIGGNPGDHVAETLVPGQKVTGVYPPPGGSPNPGHLNAWAICHLWRVPGATSIGCMWWQKGTSVDGPAGNTGNWRKGRHALLANCRYTLVGEAPGRLLPEAGWITFISDHIGYINGSTASVDRVGGTVNHTSEGGGNIRCVSQEIPTDPDAPNNADMAIITINHGGFNWDGDGGESGTSDDSSIRINGVQGPRFNAGAMASWGATVRTVVGSPYKDRAPSSTNDMFYAYNNLVPDEEEVKAFSGDLCEWYTVLGRSTNSDLSYGNDKSVGHPSLNGGSDGDAPNAGNPSGTIDISADPYPVDGSDNEKAAWTQQASDIELMEGVIAHKYAISKQLPDTYGTQIDGLHPAHPFGGLARYPVGAGSLTSPVTDPTAGALDSARPILAKWGALGGKVIWALNGSAVSHGVISDSDRGLLCIGEMDGSDTTKNAIVRKIIDYGSTYSVAGGDGAWTHTTARNLVPSDDEFTGWNKAANLIKFDRDETGPFGTGKAWHWTGAEDDGGGLPNTFVYYRFHSASGNQLTDGVRYTFSVYVRNFNAVQTDIIIWDADLEVGGTNQTLSRLIITWSADEEGSGIASTANTGNAGVDSVQTYAAIGGGWFRISCTITYESDHGDLIKFQINPGNNNPSNTGVFLWGPQVSVGATAGEYPPVPLFGHQHIKPKVDGDDNLYWPRGNGRTLAKYSGSDGTRTWAYQNGDSEIDAVRAIALDPVIPLYDTDFLMPQHLYLATLGGQSGTDPDDDLPTVKKVQIVSEDQVIGAESSARATRYLAIGGGDVTVLEKGLAPTVVATGGSGAFDAVAPHISTALFRNRLYMTDGRTYKYYDAKDNEVVDFVSKDAGEIPKRGRLMTVWDNRLVIARTADSDHNWYMSKKGVPDEWDAYPNIWTVLDAVNGDSTRGPGQSPDIINTLIPWSDDLLLIGGDHTVQRMTGNPLAGGQIDLISDQTGISFGSPWAKDPEGVLYFFGSRGGVYAYAPGQQVTRISLDSIDRDLQDVNLGLYEIGMAWSYREDGLYIFQMPHGTGGITQKGWFFERKTGAWYDMEFAATTLQPTAIMVFDGDDPGDRIVAFGCEDGFVRFFDENAKNDDGTRIDSRVTIGPMAVNVGTRARFSRLQVALASDQDGAEYEWFSSDSPDVMGEPRIRGRLSPGRSPIMHRAISGGYLWLRLRNAAVSERWAFEAASATAASAGRARVTR